MPLLIITVILTSCSSSPIILPKDFVSPQPRQEIKPTPPEPLAAFQLDTVDDKNYYLGAGDELTIEIWGYPELSGKHIIGPDGNVTLPIVGPYQIANLTREQAADTITKALSAYYVNLTTTVKVERYSANRILMLGKVNKPGEIQFGMTSPTLLEAISLAGGFSQDRRLEGQNVPLTRCAVFRGRDQIVWIDMEPLLTGKDLSLNLKLRRNDIIYVPEIEERLIYVLGEVSRPGAFQLTPSMSFIEALARAGGPTQDAAPDRINVIRPSQGINQEMSLSELILPNNKMNIALQEGDIIYVPTNTIAKINYAVRFLTPFSTILGIYADIESIRVDRERRQLDDQEQRIEEKRQALDAEKAAIEADKNNSVGYE